MKHRIVVLGAGYAGAFSAGYLARQLHSDDFEITVVNAEPDFVERLRLHQVAAGRDLRHRPLAEVFAGTGVRLRVARVSGIDVDDKTVTLADGDRLGYDSLLYALGSTAADHGVPGVGEHAFHVAARPAALRLRAHLAELGEGGAVLVVGGNLTAIETATELAEAHPGLRVALATSGALGGWLGPKARRHLLRGFDRFGITVHEHTTIARVEPHSAIAADGTVFAADATVWAAGFAVPTIAAASGLDVVPDGRIRVDRQLRSVSHPDVYVAGDSVFVLGENGLPLPMSCASAGFTGMQATAAIIGDLTGRKVKATSLSYVGNHISLGRRDAIFQLVDGAAQARSGALTGRPAAWVKTAIVAGSGWAISRPTFGKPDHRYRLAVPDVVSA
ncbi:oxidoreductase [Nocardia asteroides NBRC 15531]|uniref:Oxidoreductase n=1 Tax=Nocardia asteroides NBRC 15531 TaxID=1110697 RepID=U5E801_NOCAS|nr:FAD-dependent oxidoreductase [Nocardia asteroides]TLF65447.1 oxidoreductase [Nocardia asteroides NBRC 15531]UGT47797.1 FAD-dependent oxidoreductase [Nocardia asteroides]SFM55906.1 NADH dehydrogenase, FAD-containing subunit [Nocardia asteroides]VEG33279.1 NADH dehydrogenase-like protein yjlD [Nocardia asteroides]GAD82541.1 putative oxidoreductase [Nocardia asteroides NBRC 15531]